MKAIIALVLLVIVGVVSLFVVSNHTTLNISNVKVIGESTPVSVTATNSHGVRNLAVWLEQNGTRYPLLEQHTTSKRVFLNRHEAPQTITFDAGRAKAPNLKEGKAKLFVESISNDFRASTDTASSDLDVVLAPPRVIPDDAQHYINQGGMELVTFNASGSWTEAGVKVGKYTFRSFPLPGGGQGQRFSMFAYPWDLPADITPVVYAKNLAGTEATGHFTFKVFPKKFRVRDFDLSDSLIEKLVNSVDSSNQLAPGPDMSSRFVRINGELRQKNNAQLNELRFKTEEKILWNGPFIHYGKEEADFADVRNYIFHGKKIDQQVHLGFDLSDVQNAPVNAANDGKVVWAADLGIYGNCVVVDHGYALQSIYGHMRQIDVKVGDSVKKGQKMGIAGQTGLAGGVHVHFSMQVDGVQINPREWWDEHWIKDRILSKLDPTHATQTASVGADPSVEHPRKSKGHKRAR